MFLTAYNLPFYLISKGLVSADSVVEGDLVVAEAGRRNRNFKVFRRKQPSLFVKQIKTTDAQATSTIQREAGFYKTIHSDQKYAGISRLIPKFVDFEAKRHAIALGLTENAESLSEHHVRHGRLPEETARMIGSALGMVHSHGPILLADPAARSLFPYQVAWPMMLDQMGVQFMDTFGPIGPQLRQGIQQLPTLQPMLAALRPLWQYDSLIHGDMKWDNCLLSQRNGGPPELTIVDWELSDIGDGAWDVATIFKEYLVAAILNSQARHAAAAQNLPAPADESIAASQPSIRAFWNAYELARGLSGAGAAAYLDRAVRFTAARMVIAVLEYLAASPQYAAMGTTMLQTAVNILESPRVAMEQMVGASQPLPYGRGSVMNHDFQ